MRWEAWRVLVALAAAGLAGCAGPDVRPRPRLGALPFPGPFTLYVSTETSELGEHHYASPLDRPIGKSDGARGVVYTCKAGFLDLAHLRESVDWTWWGRNHVKRLMLAGGGELSFENDETTFHLIVHESAEVERLPLRERAAVIDEAALKLGQRVAFMVETWHEVESWYGLRTVFFVPEDRSAFTWDDTASHAVGMRIGAQVVGVGAREYDEKAAAAIKAELEELGAVPKAWVDKAVHRVAGTWWTGETPLKRDMDTGITRGWKEPWIVRGLECCEGVEPVRLEVPSLKSVRGHDLSGMYELRLTLDPTLAAEIYQGRPVPREIDAEKEMPDLIERLRAEFKAKFGEDVDKP